jgi:hypothetical protein
MVYFRRSPPIRYEKLCIATGASPRKEFNSPNVIRIRDLETIEQLQNRLPSAKRILILGNGGIASELTYKIIACCYIYILIQTNFFRFELKNVEIVWCIRHGSISATYFDEVASKFFEPKLMAGRKGADEKPDIRTGKYFSVVNSLNENREEPTLGCSLGPHWLAKLAQKQPHSDEVISAYFRNTMNFKNNFSI